MLFSATVKYAPHASLYFTPNTYIINKNSILVRSSCNRSRRRWIIRTASYNKVIIAMKLLHCPYPQGTMKQTTRHILYRPDLLHIRCANPPAGLVTTFQHPARPIYRMAELLLLQTAVRQMVSSWQQAMTEYGLPNGSG